MGKVLFSVESSNPGFVAFIADAVSVAIFNEFLCVLPLVTGPGSRKKERGLTPGHDSSYNTRTESVYTNGNHIYYCPDVGLVIGFIIGLVVGLDVGKSHNIGLKPI